MKYSILLLLSLQFFSAKADENWSLEKDKEGIKVWTRRMPDSKLKEYKATVTLSQMTVDKLVVIFKNIKYHDKLFYKCQPGSVTLVKKLSDADFYTYMIINAPLVKDRDVVTHYQFSAPDASGAVTVSLDAAPSLVPVKADYVRVPKTKGYWKFIPLAGGQVQVIHQAYSSPGGSVPDALANSASVDAPFDMLTKLKLITGN